MALLEVRGLVTSFLLDEGEARAVDGVSFTLDAGSAAKEGGAAGDVTVGNGSVALHLSGSGRRTGDYRSPEGDVPNSFNRAAFAEVVRATIKAKEGDIALHSKTQ